MFTVGVSYDLDIVSCGCQATLHDLLYNCTYCGYILCKREENKEQDKQQCPFCKRYINRNYVLVYMEVLLVIGIGYRRVSSRRGK